MVISMIELTKLNDELILINPAQIEYVEFIPESKIIMMNGRYHIVKEDKNQIAERVIYFQNRCNDGIKAWKE